MDSKPFCHAEYVDGETHCKYLNYYSYSKTCSVQPGNYRHELFEQTGENLTMGTSSLPERPEGGAIERRNGTIKFYAVVHAP
jgi:hypothetical protein